MPELASARFVPFRQALQMRLQQVPPDIVDRIPPGCRNNIRWLAGHIALSTERLILKLAGEATFLPEEWVAWFSRDTSPADFTAATPAWPEILVALEESGAVVAAKLDEMDPARELVTPFRPQSAPIVAETVGAATAMALWHEGLHAGQIMTYRNILTAQE